MGQFFLDLWKVMYSKILAHTISYNGLQFNNNPTLHIPGGFLCMKEFSFFEVPTSISTEKYAMRHGEYVSPTEKKNRRIRLLFDILAESAEERWYRLRKVQRAFSPELNPSPFNPNLRKRLTFMDQSGKERECQCQVLKGVELSDFGNEKRASVSVELITNSAEIRSTIKTIIKTKNTRQGIKLGTKLPFSWQYYHEALEYQSVLDTPLNIICSITEAQSFPLNYLSVKCWSLLWQLHNINSLNTQVGDQIKIDSLQRRAYLIKGEEKSDITGLVALGSQWPRLTVEPTMVSVDCGRLEKVLDVDLVWQEVF